MERYHEFVPDRKKESPFERNFLDSVTFEYHTEIPRHEVETFRYSRSDNAFTPVPESSPKKGVEVLYHNETSTLIVPPPNSGTLVVQDLAQMALPVVGYIDQTQPDVIIGCDRGARLYSIAVHSMYRARHPKERLHTLDSKIHFARLSTSLSINLTSAALREILDNSLKAARQRRKSLNGKRPLIMFIDDWIVSGATRKHILESLKELGISSKVDTSFALMCGPSGNVTGNSKPASVPWHDDEASIGVGYTDKGIPYPTDTREARQIRRILHRAVKQTAAALR